MLNWKFQNQGLSKFREGEGCSGVRCSWKAIKKWNHAICSNEDGLEGHYAKWNKLIEKENTIRYYLFAESKR